MAGGEPETAYPRCFATRRGTVIELHPDLELTSRQAEALLQAWLGGSVTCTGLRALEGGLVNTVIELEFDRSPGSAVVKLHGRSGDPFAKEAAWLGYLRDRTACPVPQVYLHDNTGSVIPHAALLLEHIHGECMKNVDLDPAEQDDLERQLAGVLADLHTHHGDGWGDPVDPDATSSWADVFAGRLRELRLEPTVIGRLPDETLASIDRAIASAPAVLSRPGRPTLIHGDVWEGNLMIRRKEGRWRLVALLDPNLQFADVEVELAYLDVFDNERPAFFAAYGERHAPRPGYEERRLFYWLHTALVHVALFDEPFFQEYTQRIAVEISSLG